MWKSCNSLLRMRSKGWRNNLLAQEMFVTETNITVMHVTLFKGFNCKKFEGIELETRYEEYIGVFIITYENNESQLRFQHSVLIPGRAAVRR